MLCIDSHNQSAAEISVLSSNELSNALKTSVPEISREHAQECYGKFVSMELVAVHYRALFDEFPISGSHVPFSI